VDERAKRLGLNETAFRRANERIESVAHGFSLVTERADFLCECATASCTERISLTLAEYEHVRSSSTWFVVAHGHEVPDIERLVEERATYAIVEKLPGGPAGIAIKEDERRQD
jgi:tRNA(Phe) wybutosine-synthesizing methylase Tyw3